MKTATKLMSVIAVLLMAGTALMCVIIPVDTDGETPLTVSSDKVLLNVSRGLTNENIENLQKLGIENPTTDVWDNNGTTTVFTMNNINFKTTASTAIEFKAAGSTDITFIIKLVGENKITYGPGLKNNSPTTGILINPQGHVTTTIHADNDNGSLEVKCSTDQKGFSSYGIDAGYNTLEIKGGSVVKVSSANVKTDFEGDSVSVGINAQSINVENSKVIATGGNITHKIVGEDEINSTSAGIVCDDIVFDNAIVECRGGNVSYDGSDDCSFIATSFGLKVNNMEGTTWKMTSIKSFGGEAIGTTKAISIGISLYSETSITLMIENGLNYIRAEASDAFGREEAYSIGFDSSNIFGQSNVAIQIQHTTLTGKSSFAMASEAKGISTGIAFHSATIVADNHANMSLLSGISPYTPEEYTENMESMGIFASQLLDNGPNRLVYAMGDKAIKNNCFDKGGKYGRDQNGNIIENVDKSQNENYDYIISFPQGDTLVAIIDAYGDISIRGENGLYSTHDAVPEYTYATPEGEIFSHYRFFDAKLVTTTVQEGDDFNEIPVSWDRGAPVILFAVFDDVEQQPPAISDAAIAIISVVVFASALVAIYFYYKRI